MASGIEYSDEVASLICERLVEPRSLRSICLDDDMPSQATVFRWLADERYSAFRERYAHARETQADALFDEVLDIADDGSNDWMVRHDEERSNLGWKENGEALNRSRIRIDARKWMAGKLRPKVYGEKQAHEHTGKDGGPIQLEQVEHDAASFRSRLLSGSVAGETGGGTGEPVR